MKKFGTWLLNHLGILLGVVTFIITFAVIGSVMLNSKRSYDAYEKQFNQADLEVRSLAAAQPRLIELNDEFKSEYKNELSLKADELKVTTSQEDYLSDYIDLTEKGGSVSTKLTLAEKSFVDIDFLISTEYVKVAANEDEEDEFGIKDLIANVQFIINGETMEEEGVDLIEKGWHHLIMVSFALPAGEVTVEVKNINNKANLMPYIKTVTFYSSEVLSIAEEPAEETAE